MKTKTFTTLDYSELERFAKDVFRINYEYAAEEELSNDTSQTYNVDQHDIETFEWKEWAGFLEGTRQWRAHLLLTRLVMLGKIPAGDILVDCSW